MFFYDSHTHLNSPWLFPKYKEYIENFIKIWGKKIVNAGVDYARTEKAILISKQYPKICISTVWFHPSEPIIKQSKSRYMFKENVIVSWNEYLRLVEQYIIELIQTKQIVAIWECWLDYHYTEKDGSSLSKENISKQKELFILQCKLAKEYNLPLVVHSRNSFKDTLEILKDYKNLKIYFHCWWYHTEEIEIIQKIFPNLWIWYDWNITYKKADNIRESLKVTKKKSILIETDAPYLTPQIIRNQINQPANVKYIYEYIANILNIDINHLQYQIEENFNKFFSTNN